MAKAVTFCKRAHGTSVEDFRDALATTHTALAARVPGLRRYVQSRTLRSGYRKGEPLYDAVGEWWFDDEAAARAALASPEFAAVRADGIADLASLGVIVTRDHVAKDGPTPDGGVKSFEFVTRKPGMPLEEFQRYWREVHGPLAAKIPVIRRYVQSHCVPSEYADGATPVWDGVAITWFDGTDAMRRSAATPELADTRADEPNFLAPGHLPVVITTEHVLLG